jgi:hypothetical protein
MNLVGRWELRLTGLTGLTGRIGRIGRTRCPNRRLWVPVLGGEAGEGAARRFTTYLHS